ncbi:PaaI family thioesterase [Actinomadura adrarensis]|uniref:PaaI family thioesterase n=1 Tax=Actinomadura adrarensis TaxID=1819600 RepID=A0ABW3CM44_9ACTN
MSVDEARPGLFWDMMAGRRPLPPAAVTLGWEMLEIDPDAGTIKMAFQADERFLNPAGVIQGGFISAMLDDTLGPALVATLPEGQFASTVDLHVQFLRPARPGRLIGEGRVVKRGREVCFLAGELKGPDGRPVATATATSIIHTL